MGRCQRWVRTGQPGAILQQLPAICLLNALRLVHASRNCSLGRGLSPPHSRSPSHRAGTRHVIRRCSRRVLRARRGITVKKITNADAFGIESRCNVSPSAKQTLVALCERLSWNCHLAALTRRWVHYDTLVRRSKIRTKIADGRGCRLSKDRGDKSPSSEWAPSISSRRPSCVTGSRALSVSAL
jgi:hypothetical protein